MQERRSRFSFIVAALVGVVLIVLLRNFLGGDDDPDGGAGVGDSSDGRGGCVEVVVVASSEKAALLGQIAGDFNESGSEVDGRCAAVEVSSVASGGAMAALARGWDEDVDGPRPDVWTPAASSWVVILQQRLAENDSPNLVPSGEIPHVAQSPLVIAMPRPMAEELGWPNKAIGWSDVFDLSSDPSGWGTLNHPEWGPFRLGKTNPDFSTSGLNATIGAYFAATGLSSDLTVDDVRRRSTKRFVQQVESSVVHYGDTTLTFLENLQRADDQGQGLNYISAVTVEEKSVWDYNQGNPTGDPATLGDHPKPATPLAAIYPKEGTLLSDHPYVTLDAPWVDDAKRAVAADFLEFLQEDSQQQRFLERGFRDFRGRTGDAIDPSLGMLPKEPSVVLDPPGPTVLDEVQRSWQQLRKRARVLLIIDVSGSMGEPVPDAGASKLDLAKRAATSALTQFAKGDEVGLWIFSTNLVEDQPYREILPPAPIEQQRDEMRSRIESLVPDGGTALYATLRVAVEEMRSQLDPAKINGVILLTDGRNEYPPDTNVESLLDQLEVEDESVSVRVFPIAYGDDADFQVLERIGETSGGRAYDASDPATIVKIFTEVVSNF